MTQDISTEKKYAVRVNTVRIGSIRYFPHKNGWLFTSLLPSGAGRSVKAAEFNIIVRRVLRRFPEALIDQVEAS